MANKKRPKRQVNRLWAFWLESGRTHACADLCEAIADAIYECELVWVTTRRSRRRRRIRVLRLIPNVREAHPRCDHLRFCPFCGEKIVDLVMPPKKKPAPLTSLVVPASLPPDIG
jgi:hypothetical protein